MNLFLTCLGTSLYFLFKQHADRGLSDNWSSGAEIIVPLITIVVAALGIIGLFYSFWIMGKGILVIGTPTTLKIFQVKNGRKKLLNKVTRDTIKDVRLINGKNNRSYQEEASIHIITDQKNIPVIKYRKESDLTARYQELRRVLF